MHADGNPKLLPLWPHPSPSELGWNFTQDPLDLQSKAETVFIVHNFTSALQSDLKYPNFPRIWIRDVFGTAFKRIEKFTNRLHPEGELQTKKIWLTYEFRSQRKKTNWDNNT